MSFSFYQASAPVFIHSLGSLSVILDKAAAYAEARKIDQKVMCGLRLTADMLPLSRQVSTACDSAKLAIARLASAEAPKYADDEVEFAALRSRIDKTVDFIRSVPQADIEAGADRTVSLKVGGEQHDFPAAAYLTLFALPNFFFHVTTAYAILRSNGVELGKRDFLGPILG